MPSGGLNPIQQRSQSRRELSFSALCLSELKSFYCSHPDYALHTVPDDYKDEKRLLTATMLRRLEVEEWDKERMKHFYLGEAAA